MTAHGVAVLVLIGSLFAIACILGFKWACDWMNGRQDARTAAATFEADFIPEVADVAAQDREAEERRILAQLVELTDTLRVIGR